MWITALVILAVAVYSIIMLEFQRKSRIFYIIRGIPGSGKSTLAKKLAAENGVHYSETDQFLYNENGVYEWSQDRLLRAIDLCNDAVTEKLVKKESVVILTGMFTRWSAMREYVETALMYGYRVEVITCLGEFSPIEEHKITPEIMMRTKTRFVPSSNLPSMVDVKYSEYRPHEEV